MRLAIASPSIGRAVPSALPETCREQPSSQRLVIDDQPVLTRQMLRRERGAKTCPALATVFLSHQRQHLLALLSRSAAIRGLPHVPMHEGARAALAIPAPNSFHLAITHMQYGRRTPQRQRPSRHARHHIDAAYFLRTHRRPPHSALLRGRA
jgi:hypothetical protein